ncbi:hypothetical protein D3C78_1530440 [compost metagenome]
MVDLDPFEAAGRRLLHEDVAADVIQLGGHFCAVLGQWLSDVDRRVYRADRLRMLGLADKADRLARDAHTDRDFRTHRDEIEMFGEGAAAQAGFLVSTVVAHLGAQQAGADGDFGFGCARVRHGHLESIPVQRLISVQLCSA